jgi:chitodextrinase
LGVKQLVKKAEYIFNIKKITSIIMTLIICFSSCYIGSSNNAYGENEVVGQSNVANTDTQCPGKPLGLHTESVTSTSTKIIWTSSSDNIGTVGYEVYCNDQKIGVTGSTYFNCGNLNSNTNYEFKVRAYDAAGNKSIFSDVLQTKTLDKNIPEQNILHDSTAQGTVPQTQISTVSTTAVSSDADTQSPTIPSDLRVDSKTASSIKILWNYSKDNVATVGYEVYCNGQSVGLTKYTEFDCYNLNKSTIYEFKVRAYDAAGNKSEFTDPLSVTTYTDDYGNSVYETTYVEMNKFISGKIDFPSDIDFFSFIPPESGVYAIRSYGTDGAYTDVWAQIDDYNYKTIDSNNNGGGNGQFLLQGELEAGKTYYIYVGGGIGNYSFDIKKVEKIVKAAPPINFRATLKDYIITFEWDDSPIYVGDGGYEIYRDNDTYPFESTSSCIAKKSKFTDSVSPGSTHTYTIISSDCNENVIGKSEPLTITAPLDTEPPSNPSGLKIESRSGKSITMSWNSSIDNYYVLYDVYCNNAVIGAMIYTNKFIYDCSKLNLNTKYTFFVKAHDSSGNMSEASNSVDIGTVQAPSNLNLISRDQGNISFGWNALADNNCLVGYKIYRDGIWIGDTTNTSYTDNNLLSNKEYKYSVRAYDFLDNVSNSSEVLEAKTLEDTTPPTIPSNLIQANSSNTTNIIINWQASTDYSQTVLYAVYRDGIQIGASNTTQYVDSSVNSNGTYVYTIKAYDLIGNMSDYSSPLQITINNHYIAKINTMMTGSIVNSYDFNMYKFIPAEDGSYDIRSYGYFDDYAYLYDKNGNQITYNDDGGGNCQFLITSNLKSNEIYYIKVTGWSSCTGSYEFMINKQDSEPPTSPSNVRVLSNTCTSVSLGWDASTDNVGVAGYQIYRDGIYIEYTTSTNYTSYNLLPNHQYTYTIKAYDARNNISISSEALTATTVVDNEPPTVPSGLNTVLNAAKCTIISWYSSSDNANTVTYDVYRDGVKVGTVNQAQFVDLNTNPNVNYVYTIKAYDSSGNNSAFSNPLSVTAIDPTSVECGVRTSTGNLYDSYKCYKFIPSEDNCFEIRRFNYNNYSETIYLYDKDGNYINSISGRNAINNEYYILSNLKANRPYYIKVVGYYGLDFIVRNADTQVPTAPANLTVVSKNLTTVSLKWDPSSDNVSVAAYAIYINNNYYSTATTGSTQYTCSGMTPNTTYNFTVRAYDTSGNYSSSSNITVTTDADTEPPTAPANLQLVSKNSGSIALKWSASGDNSGISRYDVYRNDVKIGSITYTSYTDSTVLANSQYNYYVKAVDIAQNVSQASNTLGVSTIISDTEPPTVPQNIQQTNPSLYNASELRTYIQWAASTDNDVSVGYDVYCDGVKVGTNPVGSNNNSFYLTGLKLNTHYNIVIKAFDRTGNYSASSTPFVLFVPDDYGNSQDSAAVMTLDSQITGKFDYNYDVDCFKFIPTESGNYVFTAPVSPSISLQFYNKTINSYINPKSYSSNANTYYVLKLDANKEYYISCSGNTNYSYVVKMSKFVDIQPPSIPANLVLQLKTGNMIQISWSVSSDNTLMQGYKVYRNGVQIGYTEANSFTDIGGLLPATEYIYTVRSVDTSDNTSLDSSPLRVTTYNDEYGNDMNSAASILLGVERTGTINYTSDKDYFEFVPGKDGVYYFRCLEGSNVSATLFDSSGAQLEQNLNFAGNFIFETLTANNKYYIGLTGANNNLGSYKIKVTGADILPPTKPSSITVSAKTNRVCYKI